jgi:hypothetical protein
MLILILPALAPGAELPVRQVVLYRNGVGYFERAGEIRAGDTAQLSFRQIEMNDILKSLTVRDASGNAVSAVRYDSAEPLEEKLAAFPFARGADRSSLSSFLHHLQGARLSVRLGTEQISGLIVLARRPPTGDRQTEQEQVILLLDSGEMRTIDLGAVSGLQFAESSIQSRFREYLRILAASVSAEKRVVTIDSAATSTRSVVASYLVPAPVWKSSYRMILGSGGETTFEGWAIVDNTSGEDWNGVRLSLVSGRPVSFISNLFEARNMERQTAELPDAGSVNPVVHEAGVAGGVIGGIIGAVPAAPPPPPPPAVKAAPAFYQPKQAASSIDTRTTAAREFADLFEYSFGRPITIRAGESAMLPFVQQKIGTRKLLIYSDVFSQHPMSAVELTNTTGKTLDGGPITVFEGSSYAGESLMTTLKNGDKRLVSYAVDLGTRVGTALDSATQDIREVHLRRGVLSVRWAQRSVQTYTIRNVDPRAKTLLIEYPIRGDRHLIGVKPVETTATAYRFEVNLAPDAEERFAVTEEHLYDTSVTVSSVTPDQLLAYVKSRELTPAGRKVLEHIGALKQTIAALQQQIQSINGEVRGMEQDQERTRQNIRSLNEVSGQQDQVQRYARQLAERETRLANLRDRQTEMEKQRAGFESEVNAVIDSTEF